MSRGGADRPDQLSLLGDSTPHSASPARLRLLHGDCLELLRGTGDLPRARLVYLDPPFQTARDFGAFRDIWAWGEGSERALTALAEGGEGGARVALALRGLLGWLGEGPLVAYLAYVGERLAAVVDHALHPAGTLVLHCDPQASHYLKLLLDALLGADAFLNEVVWHYRRWPVRSKFLQRMHDVLLVYRASPGEDSERRFNTLLMDRAPSTQRRWGKQRIRARHDAQGRRLPSLDEEEESPGTPLDDVWDLPIIAPSARERVGYPTQKPLRLLERIVRITTDPGDWVCDPFCGSGSTLIAALRLERRALGMDLNDEALALAQQRADELRPG